jgi:23S rRNA-/tRNA-specific pseudouridylate synthase
MIQTQIIPVLRVGKGWLGVNKPAGLSIHNNPGEDLCAWAETHCLQNKAIYDAIAPDPDFGFHPVHRLDRETSGVVLLACDRETLGFLSAQFEARKVEKRYLALLHGHLEFPEDNAGWQKWTWPLTKAAGGRGNPAGAGHRFPCETHYQLLSRLPRYTLIEIKLLTGRKHQIRRHAALAGHAVVGDPRYGTSRAADYLRHQFGFDRFALHASSLTLKTPGTGRIETISASLLPSQIEALINS